MSPINGVGCKWRAAFIALLFMLLPMPALAVNFTGKVGIGTTSPASKLHISDLTGSTAWMRIEGPTTAEQSISLYDANANWVLKNEGNSNSFGIYNTGGLRMAIDSSGNVLFNSTANNAGATARQYLAFNSSAEQGIMIQTTDGGDSANGAFVRFANHNTSCCSNLIGGIFTNGSSAVQYLTSSDRRLKENIATTTSGLALLTQIPVRDFDFIGNPDTRVQGFIAQELHAYYPDAVHVGGDPNGPLTASSTPWSVDYGRLTPLLTKAIQDLNAKVDSQAATIETLHRNIAAQGGLSSGSLSADEKSSFSSKLRALFATVGLWFTPASRAIESDMAQVTQTEEIESQGHNPAESDSLTIGSPERPAGFTMYDIHDGRPHCVYLNGGNLLPVLGTCDQTDARLFGQN